MNNENKSGSDVTLSEQKQKKNYILKILFGPMYGCELQLPAADYFLIVNPSSKLLDENYTQDSEQANSHAISFVLNSLYIPCDAPSANLILKLSQSITPEQSQRFHVQVNDSFAGIHSLYIENNILFSYGNIKLAIKEDGEPWSDDINAFPTQQHPSVNNDKKTATKLSAMNFKRNVFIGVLISMMLICSAAFFLYLNKDGNVTTLNQALIGAPSGIHITPGENQKIYIIIENQRALEWTSEALTKIGYNKNILIYPIYKKSKELATTLNLSGYPILRFDYSDPKKIKVLLFKALAESQKFMLNKTLVNEFPFTESFTFITKSETELISEAKQGLERLNIHFKQINTASGYGFIIRDALSDNALNLLNNFIRVFQSKWGYNFITFSIHLEENWLQNKSYVDSNNGYLFLNPRHWYFPIKNKEL